MKCIKLVNEIKGVDIGSISRVSDLVADKKVNEGYYVYVPKSEWRLVTRPTETLEKARKKYPANVDGTPEFNAVNSALDKKTKKEKKVKKDKPSKEKKPKR